MGISAAVKLHFGNMKQRSRRLEGGGIFLNLYKEIRQLIPKEARLKILVVNGLLTMTFTQLGQPKMLVLKGFPYYQCSY